MQKLFLIQYIMDPKNELVQYRETTKVQYSLMKLLVTCNLGIYFIVSVPQKSWMLDFAALNY